MQSELAGQLTVQAHLTNSVPATSAALLREPPHTIHDHSNQRGLFMGHLLPPTVALPKPVLNLPKGFLGTTDLVGSIKVTVTREDGHKVVLDESGFTVQSGHNTPDYIDAEVEYTVSNTGLKPSGKFHILHSVRRNGSNVYQPVSAQVELLPAQSKRFESTNFVFKNGFGVWTAELIVDSKDEVAESKEHNNRATLSFIHGHAIS